MKWFASMAGVGSGVLVSRNCLPREGAMEGCVTAEQYIRDYFIPIASPGIINDIVGQSGVACFCSGHLCNAELSEPPVIRGKCLDLFWHWCHMILVQQLTSLYLQEVFFSYLFRKNFCIGVHTSVFKSVFPLSKYPLCQNSELWDKWEFGYKF